MLLAAVECDGGDFLSIFPALTTQLRTDGMLGSDLLFKVDFKPSITAERGWLWLIGRDARIIGVDIWAPLPEKDNGQPFFVGENVSYSQLT